MRQAQQTFLACVCFLSVVCFSAIAARAQAVSSYIYLEVLDSNKQPVSEAKAETTTYAQIYNQKILQTDADGKATFRGYYNGREKLKPEFTIIKPGYLPFQDFGTLLPSLNREIKIELLKIPENKSERKILGDEQRKREFFQALQNGEIETVRKMLKSGVSPNLTLGNLRGISGYENVPAIIYPAVTGDGATLKMMLEAGADISRKDEFLPYILFHYLYVNIFDDRRLAEKTDKVKRLRDYNDGLKALIKAGIDVNAKPFAYSESALIYAIQAGKVGAVKILIEKGANIDAPDNEGKTPLTIAKKYFGYNDASRKSDYEEIIKILAEAGAK